jgi:hypothetical protein
MKPKLLLCLAFVLSGGLFGCSTVPSGALSDSSEGKLFSNQEAVCLKSDDSSRPWQLKYALTEPTWNEGNLFTTVHERGDVDSMADISKWRREYTAAIYVKAGEKFKLLKRLHEDENSSGSYFLKPNFIWAVPKGEDREQLIQITEAIYGTGGFTEEHIFTTVVMPVSDLKLTPEIKLEEVEFIPAWESYQFGKDECLWKGEFSRLTDDGLFFEFIIWKHENKTNHPVGKVTGTYKLERKPDGKLRIIMDKFKREPITDSDSS